MNRSDKELLNAISSGNEQAFHVLFNRHWKALFAFVYRLTKDENSAKDILQDVFMHVWNNRETLYSQDSFLPYLNTVAKNNVMSAFRKEKVRLQGADVLLNSLQRSNQSDDQLMMKEVQQAVDSELAKMPFNMRLCFQLSRYQDKPIRDIASELTLSEQTVKNNISEALRRLRNSIEQGSLLYLSVLVIKTILKD